MNPVIAWRIYYSDESVLEGRTVEEWVGAPDEGVIVVVEIYAKDVHRKKPLHTIQTYAGCDYYWMTPDGLVGAGAARRMPSDAHGKSGVTVSDELYMQIYNAACVPPEYGTV